MAPFSKIGPDATVGALNNNIMIKSDTMSEYQQERITQENEWNRFLNFIQQEANILKKRLRHIISNQIDSSGLTDAENLLARLIRMDEMLNRMRNYIFEFRRQFSKETDEIETEKRISQLKEGMISLENSFILLRNDFNLFAAKRRAA